MIFDKKMSGMKTEHQPENKQWLALLFSLPIYIFPVWRYLSTDEAFSLMDLFIYTGGICSIEIVVILLLQRFWLQEKLSKFNLKASTLWKDLFAGILLGGITLTLSFFTRNLLTHWLEDGTISSGRSLFGAYS